MEETRMEEGPMKEKPSPLKGVEQNISDLLKRIKCLLGYTIDIRLLITQGSSTRPEALTAKDRKRGDTRIGEMKLELDECIELISTIRQEHNLIINQVS